MIDRLLSGLVILSTFTPAGVAAASGPTFSHPLNVTNLYQPFMTTLGGKPETKWYARGVGPIKSKTPGEKSELVASTLLRQ